MPLGWVRRGGPDADITTLAKVLRDSGNDVQLFSDALLALTPEQRIEVLSKVVNSLPPLVRGLVWSEAGLAANVWPDVAATLAQEERRPRVVQALVERGGETRALDLSQVPACTELTVDLYGANYVRTPDQIKIPSNGRMGSLVFTALGDGAFMPKEDLCVPIAWGDNSDMLPRGRQMAMGMADPQGAFVPVLSFGRPMLVDVPNRGPTELLTPGRNHLFQCDVGRVALDDCQVFTR